MFAHLEHFPGEDLSEFVTPEHVNDEVGGRVDGQQHVGDGDDFFDHDGGFAELQNCVTNNHQQFNTKSILKVNHGYCWCSNFAKFNFANLFPM